MSGTVPGLGEWALGDVGLRGLVPKRASSQYRYAKHVWDCLLLKKSSLTRFSAARVANPRARKRWFFRQQT